MSNRKQRSVVLLNWVRVERGAAVPLHRQIGDQIRGAIVAGRIRPGSYLPASRALALDLGVSRATTLQAYEQLVAEGFLQTRAGSGTRVSPALEDKPLATLAAVRELDTRHVQHLYVGEPQNVAFQPGIPAFDAFPRATWSRLLQRHAGRGDQFILDYAHIGGYAPLRQEVAKYLNASRGVACDPEQTIVTTSVRAAIALVAAVLWPPGAEIAVEDPGYGVARRVIAAAGMHLRPVAVDGEGLRVDDLASDLRCAGAYLTPAHHWPTGCTLSAARRVRVLDWAVRAGAWILEDDYDAEFRFDSPPVAPLHALGSGRVVYMGTFSKTLAPSIRTAYIVVPRELVTRFERRVFQNGSEPALHVQAGLSDFMAEGHFVRHIAAMRKLYRRRRALLMRELRAAFGPRLSIVAPPGGLQVIAMLPDDVPAFAVARRAAAADLVARSFVDYHVSVPPLNALHLGFAAVPDREIAPGVARLKEAVADLL